MHENRHQVDYLLMVSVFGLFIISLVAVYSGSGQYVQDQPFYFTIRQCIWYGIGIGLMVAIAKFDYELLEKWAFPLYIAGIGMLLMVYFFGTVKNGSQRWINLGIIEIQPSEFMKIFLILYLAYILSKVGETKLSFKKSIPITLKAICCSVIPFLFILVQPDLGSALVIIGVAASLFVVSSISSKMILILVGGITSLIGFLIYLFHYQHDLFTKILQPHQL